MNIFYEKIMTPLLSTIGAIIYFIIAALIAIDLDIKPKKLNIE